MCEYCEKPIFVKDKDGLEYCEWYKDQDIEGAGEFHLFFRKFYTDAEDENPWHFSHNGNIIKINFCPFCGRKLNNESED